MQSVLFMQLLLLLQSSSSSPLSASAAPFEMDAMQQRVIEQGTGISYEENVRKRLAVML